MTNPMPASLIDSPVFICGHPKAGTSLIRAILDGHPQLIVYPEESIFFRRFLPKAINLGLPEQILLAEKELIHIFQWDSKKPAPSQEGYPDRDYSFIPFEEVRQELSRMMKENYRHPGDILRAAVLAYGQVSRQITPQTIRWVEKSPYNEYHAGKIFEWWPQARCIHIVRDPRDNFVSYRRKHPKWNAEFFSMNWLRSTQAGLQNQEHYSSQRYLVMRYEDLTASPQEYLNKLVAFLGINWDESLVEPTRAGIQWRGNSMFANQFQSISSAPVARWKEKLNNDDAAVVSLMTRPFLERLGYSSKSEIEKMSRENRKARWRIASWPIRRRFNRLFNQ